MLSFRVKTAARSFDYTDNDFVAQPSFGTLLDCGVLSRHYYFMSRDPDSRVLVWTVRVPCRINGVDYAANDKIEWPK